MCVCWGGVRVACLLMISFVDGACLIWGERERERDIEGARKEKEEKQTHRMPPHSRIHSRRHDDALLLCHSRPRPIATTTIT